MSYISATAKIEAYKQRMKLFDLPVETLKSSPPWKSCLECEWRVCVSSTDALVLFKFSVVDEGIMSVSHATTPIRLLSPRPNNQRLDYKRKILTIG